MTAPRPAPCASRISIPARHGSDPTTIGVLNGTLFLYADDGVSGQELWKSDGTEAGTVRVKDINPGAAGSSPAGLGVVNGALLLSASDGAGGQEVWKTDGTEAGTVLVKNLQAVAVSLLPGSMTTGNSTVFMAGDDGTSGLELWKTDGTAAGTVRVKDIQPGAGGSSPNGLYNLDGTYFFNADDGTHGRELWKSDGTEVGTVMVGDIQPGPAGSYPFEMVLVNGTLFVTADDGQHGRELWAFAEPRPDLTLSLTVAPSAPVHAADAITYTLAFSNQGDKLATGVVITDVLPSELMGLHYSSSGMAITRTGTLSYTWLAGNLAPGAGVVITMTGHLCQGLATGTHVTNTAWIATTMAEMNMANNSHSATVTVANSPARYPLYLPVLHR